ncbi:hypothetical protein B296_00049997 [Ensete ventricosum]|uniref:Uncharacterized protein n=1 Tax=Ensete ventricosum TaxID=4639 RepID=A0A426XCP9_ENSVE|nr:hypothetical protein B296_00049997 [Ensete ventricosum]
MLLPDKLLVNYSGAHVELKKRILSVRLDLIRIVSFVCVGPFGSDDCDDKSSGRTTAWRSIFGGWSRAVDGPNHVSLRYNMAVQNGVLVMWMSGIRALKDRSPPSPPPAKPPTSASTALIAITSKMPHLTTVITRAAASSSSALVPIFSDMAGLAAVIASSSAGPYPPSTSTAVKTIIPAAGAAAVATTVPTIPATTAATLDVGSVGPSDIDSLSTAVVALGDHELDDLTLGEGPVPFGLDGGLVDEEVLPAVIGRDETESLGVVEPLHRPPRSAAHLRHRNKATPTLTQRERGGTLTTNSLCRSDRRRFRMRRFRGSAAICVII